MKKTLAFIFFISFFLLIFPKKVGAIILFQDNFNDGNADGWNVDYLTPISGDNRWNDSKWEVNDSGEYGITFTDRQMRTISSAGDSIWCDYVYVIELSGKSGVDKNIVFRYKDKDNWYNFHLKSDGVRFGTMNNGNYSDNNGKLLSNFPFANNIVYQLKVIIDKDIVSLFVDGQCVVDSLKISNNSIPKGKIGLYASTGESIHRTSVWFDNIIVCTLDDPYNCDYPEEYFQKSPLILIPGHGASLSFKEMFLGVGTSNPDDWQMMPGVHVYDNLINTLEDNGYEKDRDLFTFYYNWLNPIAGSSAKLHDFILPIAATSPTGKVDIVGHSMGGLVGRACVQNNNEDHCFVDKLIAVGTPHKGVLEAYGAWEGGEVWRSGLSKLAFELFLNIKRGLGKTKKETIREIAPSTEEMLPIFSYFKNVTGEELSFTNDDYYPQNEFLSDLPLLNNLSNATKIIYGQNHPTLRWLTIDKNLSWVDKILGNWEYGKPIEKQYSDEGDGTVLALSAYPEASLSAANFDFNHSEIVSRGEAVEEIMEGLDLEATSSGDFQDNAQDYLVFYLHSPAHLEIENLDNLPLEDVFRGEESNQLKLAIIANPLLNQEYIVKVVGNEDVENEGNDYILTVGQINGEQSNWDNYRGLTNLGEKDMFLIKFGPDINQEGLKDIQVTEGELPLNELIDSLKIEVAQNSLLVQKLDNLKGLVSISSEKAWEYVYQIRNLTALLYKSGQVNLDIQKVNSQLDSIAVYLKVLAQNKPRVLANNETELNFQDAEQMIEEVENIPEKSLSRVAAFDFSLAQKSLKEASKSSYPAYLLTRKSYFLGRNSKALIQ